MRRGAPLPVPVAAWAVLPVTFSGCQRFSSQIAAAHGTSCPRDIASKGELCCDALSHQGERKAVGRSLVRLQSEILCVLERQNLLGWVSTISNKNISGV